MKLIKKFSIQLLAIVMMVNIFGLDVKPVRAEFDSLGINAEAAILIDAKTGQILYEKNSDTILGVASMSKMMTEYLLLEAIRDKKVTWEQEVLIDSFVHQLSGAPNLSNIGLTEGKKYTIKQLFEAMAIYSANGATVALAQVLGGTEESFVNLMNQKATELGLKDFKFVNSSGLNNADMLGRIPAGGPTDENVMSARATALLAYRLLTDFPEILETTKISKLDFIDGKTYPSFNWMLPELTYAYDGVDGLKTGSTDFAGACFTATAIRGEQRYLSVVMKCESKNDRFQETAKIMDYAFATFVKKEVIPAGQKDANLKKLTVDKGKEETVSIATNAPISILVNKDDATPFSVAITLDKSKVKKDKITAPVEKNEVVGKATLSQGNNTVSFLTPEGQQTITVDVVTEKNVEKANWFVLAGRGISDFFSGIWNSVTEAF